MALGSSVSHLCVLIKFTYRKNTFSSLFPTADFLQHDQRLIKIMILSSQPSIKTRKQES